MNQKPRRDQTDSRSRQELEARRFYEAVKPLLGPGIYPSGIYTSLPGTHRAPTMGRLTITYTRRPPSEKRPAVLYKLLAIRPVWWCTVFFIGTCEQYLILLLKAVLFVFDYLYPILHELDPSPEDHREGDLGQE